MASTIKNKFLLDVQESKEGKISGKLSIVGKEDELLILLNQIFLREPNALMVLKKAIELYDLAKNMGELDENLNEFLNN